MSTKSLISKGRKAQMARFHEPYLFLEWEETSKETPKDTALDRKQAYFNLLQEPHAHGDIFGDPQGDATPGKITAKNARTAPSKSGTDQAGRDKAMSRKDLEKLFDEAVSPYKPYIARPDWAKVMAYRSEFLDAASRDPDTAERVGGRLRALKFSLLPGEKVEANRAPAERIIDELKRLLK
jgi:hypothetical protein